MLTSAKGFGSLLAILLPVSIHAQQSTGRRILPEFRADVTIGDVTTAHATAGLHVNSGTYMRLAALAGVGRAWADQTTRISYRLELQGRFHLDPQRDARFGLYGIGGLIASHDDFTNWQSRIIVGGGVELPAHGRGTLAIEGAFAGGFRLSLALRRLTLARR